MRAYALTWPFRFGVRLGWATAHVPNPPPDHARGRVFLLRGTAAVFSRGFGGLCGQLRRAGVWAEDLRCVGDRWARSRLLADREGPPWRGPVVLVGHSRGGRSALFAAQELAGHGIAIDLLICIDAAIPFAVAPNVRRAIHLYRSRGRIYPARPLRAIAGSAAQITNFDLDTAGSPITPAGLHHLNITTSPAVRTWVLEQVLHTVVAAENADTPCGGRSGDVFAPEGIRPQPGAEAPTG